MNSNIKIIIILIFVLMVSFYISHKCFQINANMYQIKYDIPFYMIHLNDRIDRLNNTNRSLKFSDSVGLISINDGAIRGTMESEVIPFLDMTDNPNPMRNVLRKGEVGCFQSHLSAWKIGGYKGVMVCEDDVILEHNCLQQMLDEVNYIQKELDVDNFVLHGRYSMPRNFKGNCENKMIKNGLMEVRCPCYNTNLYFMSAGACKLCCNVASDPATHMPSDDFISSLSGCHETRRTRQTIRAFAITPAGLSVMRSRSDTQ